jgi:putative ABC transport system permease protein
VRIEPGQEKQTIERIAQRNEIYSPGFGFEYKFLDEDYQALYLSENRVVVLSRYFAALTVLISCLGLFGLSAFTAQRRRKEISIRKIGETSSGNIALMLWANFLKLILIAVLIAFPASWWLTNRWQGNFAYHIRFGIETFIISGFCIVCLPCSA